MDDYCIKMENTLKLQKILQICLRSFVNSHPDYNTVGEKVSGLAQIFVLLMYQNLRTLNFW